MSPDLTVFGTPCPPFSTQRPERMKRTHTDAVKAHSQYSVTFEESLALLESNEPKACIMEQVYGFGLPEHEEDNSTPKDRLGVHMALDLGAIAAIVTGR